MTSSTASSVEIYATIRNALLTYIGEDGVRLRDFIGAPEQVYVRAAPASPTFPYVTLLLDRTSASGYNSYRDTAILEVQVIGRPESQLPNCESASDLIDRCLLSLLQSSSGLMFCRSRTRKTIPLFTDPAESNVVGVVLAYELVLWPVSLTNRVT